MKVIQQSVALLEPIDGEEILRVIEQSARNCYQSSHNIGDFDSCKRFVAGLVKSGHHPVFEFAFVRAEFICSRSTSHQLVRHRIASYAQESQRYCNYSAGKFNKEVTFIWPAGRGDAKKVLFDIENGIFNERHSIWLNSIEEAEEYYFALIKDGWSAEDAREVLPNCTKTNVVVGMNIREWRHFLTVRCDKHAQTPIRELALSLLEQLHTKIPVVFDDIYDMMFGNGSNELAT